MSGTAVCKFFFWEIINKSVDKSMAPSRDTGTALAWGARFTMNCRFRLWQ